MVRPFRLGLLLILVPFSLSGCLALSFGGKTVEATPCDCTDEARLAAIESRVQALEQRLPPSLPPASGIVEPQTPAH